MINKQTIISAYDEKLTLVQWLKLVNKALDEAVLTNVEIAQRGNATFVFVFTFEDGTQVESNEIIVNQGESINGASIRDGHLYLTLTNGDELDAGNVKPVSYFAFTSSRYLMVYYEDGTSQNLGQIKGVYNFEIDNNQHLIVNFDDGTSQDLGAIFNGDISINGTLSIKNAIFTYDGTNQQLNVSKPIIEDMTGYSSSGSTSGTIWDKEIIYSGAVKNGNKLTLACAVNITRLSDLTNVTSLIRFYLPSNVVSKLYLTQVGGYQVLDFRQVLLTSDAISTIKPLNLRIDKELDGVNVKIASASQFNELTLNTKYFVRFEITFLLSNSLAS